MINQQMSAIQAKLRDIQVECSLGLNVVYSLQSANAIQ